MGCGDDMALTPPADIRDLLIPHAMHGGWEADLAPKKLFFVRKLSTFRTQVEMDVTRLNPFIPAMRQRVVDMQGWGMPHLDWTEDFSPRQVYAAYGKKTISLDKAGEVVLLAGEAAEEKHIQSGNGLDGDAVVEMLKIEPQVYYINGFREEVIEDLRKHNKDGLRRLRAFCGQTNDDVFYELANKYRKSRITLKLACSIKFYLERELSIDLGDVSSDTKAKPASNTHETIDFSPPPEVQSIIDAVTAR